MKGDYSRVTFRPEQHYWGVLRQQGRVDLDADWNEQVAIQRHLDVTRNRDLVGPSGGPQEGAGFEITAGGGGLVIGAGRYYVDGVQVVNEADVAYDDQPHPHGEPDPGPGQYLVYLDAWDRHVTALDDDHLREKGLGGPDTANRAQTVWQVKLARYPWSEPNGEVRDLLCDGPFTDVVAGLAHSGGRLAARTTPVAAGDDPCGFERRARYRLLENNLYRVEIHDPSDAGVATYKWSPHNGALAFSVEEVLFEPSATTSNRLRVRSLGRDEILALKQDDFVEVVDESDVLAGRAGVMVRITAVDQSQRIITVEDPGDPGGEPIGEALDAATALVRKWAADAAPVPPPGTWPELEGGVEVDFSGTGFRTGDYWQVPARVNTGDVEWPTDDADVPDALAPFGIHHRYAPLARVTIDDGVGEIVDLRDLFPAATAVTSLFYVGGDGQEPELPGGQVPEPLRVGVANGSAPVEGAMVQFRVVEGVGEVEYDGAEAEQLIVPTDADGVAAVNWRVANLPPVFGHRVEARLLDRCDDPLHVPIVFSTHINYALDYLSGDGQSGRPAEVLRPLRVWVHRGRFPVQGARVRFEVSQGNGRIEDPAALGAPSDLTLASGGAQRTVTTDADGVAEMLWVLDETSVRQQVAATLRGSGAAALHEAAVQFNANLNVATEVAFDPTCDNFGGIDTVAEALDFLCARDAGRACTFTVTPESDLAAIFATIQASEFTSAKICFQEGDYAVGEPLVLADKGHLIVSGAGAGSHLVAAGGGTVLRFERCASVTVRDIHVEARKPRTGGAEAGLNGALTFEDCPVVTVEQSVIRIGSWAERAGAGVTVRMTAPGIVRTWDPVRIADCQFDVGHEQVGVLLVDVERSHVENNVIRTSPLPPTLPLKRLMDSLTFRSAAERILVRDVQVREKPPEPSPSPSPSPEGRDAPDPPVQEVPDWAGGGGWGAPVESTRNPIEQWGGYRRVIVEADRWVAELTTPANAAEAWTEVLDWFSGADPQAHPDSMLDQISEVAPEVLLRGSWEDIEFDEWYSDLEEAFVSTAAQGIVVAGTVARDVRVLHNTVSGAAQGIHVGLSDAGDPGESAGVVLVHGNTVVGHENVIAVRRPEGVFAGNVDSIVVGANAMSFSTTAIESLDFAGILLHGSYGPRLLVHENQIETAPVGVRVVPLNTAAPRRWLVRDNVASAGSAAVDAPPTVVRQGNVP